LPGLANRRRLIVDLDRVATEATRDEP